MKHLSTETLREVVSLWTGVPVQYLGATASDAGAMDKLEAGLRAEVVGQDAALEALSGAIRRRTLLGGEDRPIGSFLFVGPSGVGKTEAAKALARQLFGSEDNLMRFDMSEYSEPHSKTRLVGAPPSYVGYGEGGQLTEAVKRQRFSVLLFDEIEKAHPQVLTVLLQVMDAGRLTDGSGATVDFRNTVVILTSNLGNAYVTTAVQDDEEAKGRVTDAVREFLPPEFVGRLDEIVIFRRLDVADLQRIVALELTKLANRRGDETKIISSDLALHILAEQSMNGNTGARAVRQTLQKRIEPGLMELRSRGLLCEDPATVLIDINDDGQFSFDVESNAERS